MNIYIHIYISVDYVKGIYYFRKQQYIILRHRYFYLQHLSDIIMLHIILPQFMFTCE
jgi:hypothetical protein